MADVFKQIVEANAILDGTYVEPFVGGGSVAQIGRASCRERV